MFLWRCFSHTVAVFAAGLLPGSGAGGQILGWGLGGRERGEAIPLAVTSGERGASLHFAKATTLLMRMTGAPATGVIHCVLKELAQQF